MSYAPPTPDRGDFSADDSILGFKYQIPEHSASGINHSTQTSLVKWIAAHSAQYRLAISATGITDGMPIANPFQEEQATMAYMHVNASGRVSSTSYDQQNAVAIPEKVGILTAIANYRGETA